MFQWRQNRPAFFYASLFLLAVLSSCVGDHQPGSSHGPCTTPQKITSIYREHVYDLSGYNNGAGDPFNLFDENAYVDPRADKGAVTGYLPVTDPQPKSHPSIYFQAGQGNRIVADLLTPYHLTEFYLYDRSRLTDSVWIYTGSMRHWTLQAAFLSGVTGTAGAWRRFTVDDSAQYVMIRFSSYETSITEMVLYGCPYGLVSPPAASQGMARRFTRKPMKDFLGTNYVMESELGWLRPFHYSRLYNLALDYDNDTVDAYPNIKYNMLHYGYWDPGIQDYHFNIDDIRRVNGGEVWYSIRGVPLWMDKKGASEKDRPVTWPGMDPEDPLSYARHAGMMWQMSAFFGYQRVDTALMQLSHRPLRSGRGSMRLYENGNEEDGIWGGSNYCAPPAYFAQSSADYDGHEGRMGPGHGIHLADSGARLMTSGLTELDTNRVRTYRFLCDQLRDDKKFIWTGGIQYHHYSTTGKKGLTPEEDSLRWRLSQVRASTWRIAPGVDCILGENGYDKNPASIQGAPRLPGLTPGESQGIFILRSINATAFSGFDAYILFWLRDSDPETDTHTYATAGIIGPRAGAGTIAYPAWYYISSFVHQLADYAPDSIVSEQGAAWIYRYRNIHSPDSVAYFIYAPTHNGTKLDAYPLQVGPGASGMAKQAYFPNDNSTGLETDLPIANGIIRLTVEEKPRIVKLRERVGSR